MVAGWLSFGLCGESNKEGILLKAAFHTVYTNTDCYMSGAVSVVRGKHVARLECCDENICLLRNTLIPGL